MHTLPPIDVSNRRQVHQRLALLHLREQRRHHEIVALAAEQECEDREWDQLTSLALTSTPPGIAMRVSVFDPSAGRHVDCVLRADCDDVLVTRLIEEWELPANSDTITPDATSEDLSYHRINPDLTPLAIPEEPTP